MSDIDNLIDMGFERERAELAIKQAGGRTFTSNYHRPFTL